MAQTIYGGNSNIDSTLAALAASNATLAEINDEEVFRQFDIALQAHNALMMEMVDSLVETTTDRYRQVGDYAVSGVQYVDEGGQALATDYFGYGEFGFPLRAYQKRIITNRVAARNITAKEFTSKFVAAMVDDRIEVQKMIKRAIFLSSNYTFTDVRVDKASIKVKRLQNSDSTMPVPVSPNGDTFARTHTHYLAYASLSTTALSAGIATVVEHFNEGQVIVSIAPAQESTVRGLSGFTAVQYSYLVQNVSADHISNSSQSLDPINTKNRLIGYYEGAEVWVKPWVPSSYVMIHIKNLPGDQRKLLAFRYRGNGVSYLNTPINLPTVAGGSILSNGDFIAVEQDNISNLPFISTTYEREIGVGVANRLAGAVIYIGDTTYTDPTI